MLDIGTATRLFSKGSFSIYIYTYVQVMVFPKMKVAPHHPFGIFHEINHPAIGVGHNDPFDHDLNVMMVNVSV